MPQFVMPRTTPPALRTMVPVVFAILGMMLVDVVEGGTVKIALSDFC